MSEQSLLFEKKSQVDYVTLNRPHQLNALNEEMLTQLRDYFDQLYFNNSVRVVVLKANGKAFCAGLDLKQVQEDFNPSSGLKAQRLISEIIIKMRRCPQPIVSVINGAASGGGFALALASDVRYATASTRMNAAFIRIGLSGCDVGVSYLLPRLVGSSIASELLLTGRFVDAERALRVGLVSDILDDANIEEVTQKIVDEMLATTPVGLRLTKECLNMNIDAPSLEAAIALEDRNQVLCTQTEDFGVCLDAFLSKTTPMYSDK